MWRVAAESQEDDRSREFGRPKDGGQDSGKDHGSGKPPETRCGHFSISATTLLLPGAAPPMQVPIYRCALAESMIDRMRATEEGQHLAARLEAPPLAGQPRVAYGPDLEAITTHACTADRCQRSCRPGFVQILTDLELDSSLPESG